MTSTYVFNSGYDVARSVAFYNTELVQQLMWARMSGDVILFAGPLLYLLATTKALFGTRSMMTDKSALTGPVIPSDD